MSTLEQEYYEHDGFWNPETTPLGDADFKRIEDIVSLLPEDLNSLLDVGCGNGLFCNYVQRLKKLGRVVGLDRSKAALKYVMTEKLEGDITAVPFADGEFDCVTSLEVLEHLPVYTYEQAKNELARLSRKYIIISVPNNQKIGAGMTECPACKTKFDPDLHLRSFDADIMSELFTERGFRCRDLREIGKSSNFAGVTLYGKWRNRNQPRHMASPLCPICGHRNDSFLRGVAASEGANRKHASSQEGVAITSAIKDVIKKFWPRVERSQWLVALYERTR